MTASVTVADAARSAGQPDRPAVGRRRWRLPLAIAAVVIAGGVLIALIAPSAGPADGYLDPASTQAAGTRALADILAGRGSQVIRVTSAAAAASATSHGASTIVVTSPGQLSGTDLTDLALAGADLLIVEPSPAALRALAPGVLVTGSASARPLQPRCRLAAAVLAGNADMGDVGLRLESGVPGITCYPEGRSAFLIQYSRHVTILGTGAPLQNQHLADLGNAALALNLLSGRGRIAWLIPLGTASPAAGSGTFWSLVPPGAYLVAAELGIAVLLTALWRARRLGPLVTEPLPVIVRATETTEGHAQLYQATRSRGQAAGSLRNAVALRLAGSLGLPAEVAAEVITAEIAARTRLSQEQADQLLFGPAPATDADLVALADDLDAMEKEVHAR